MSKIFSSEENRTKSLLSEVNICFVYTSDLKCLKYILNMNTITSFCMQCIVSNGGLWNYKAKSILGETATK